MCSLHSFGAVLPSHAGFISIFRFFVLFAFSAVNLFRPLRILRGSFWRLPLELAFPLVTKSMMQPADRSKCGIAPQLRDGQSALGEEHAKRLRTSAAGCQHRLGEWFKRAFPSPSSPCVLATWRLCSAVRPNCSVSQEFPMRTHKGDRIMAGQNHAERKSRGAVLNDSVVSGCGFSALD